MTHYVASSVLHLWFLQRQGILVGGHRQTHAQGHRPEVSELLTPLVTASAFVVEYLTLTRLSEMT